MTAPYSVSHYTPDEEISEKDDQIFSVSEYLSYLNYALKPLKGTVQGEIGKIDTRGAAVYFTLCDKKEKAVLNCFAWQNTLRNIGFILEEGMEVKIIGYAEIYKPYGKLSLQVQYIMPVGEGALKLAFEKLKKELDAAGYFRQERKRILPQFPQRIGLITSRSGVVITDFLMGLGNHGLHISFYDVRVEGINAIESIQQAIRWFNELPEPLDVLVIARGGGSLESLQAFNSMEIAKAIHSSKTPVLTAIGHERDVTIADLVADVRASVPLHAGKMLAEPWIQIAQRIETIEENIVTRFKNTYQACLTNLTYFQNNIMSNYAKHIYQCQKDITHYQDSLMRCFRDMLQKIKHIEDTFTYNFERFHQRMNTQLQNFTYLDKSIEKDAKNWYYLLTKKIKDHEHVLSLCDPQVKLKQGYSITKDIQGKVIKSPSQTKNGDVVTIHFYDGKVQSQIKEVNI